MNKLLTNFDNGFPFVLDDIRFMDDAFRNALESFIYGLVGDGDYILTGCEIDLTDDLYTINAGYVIVDGEICKVEAHTLNKLFESSPKFIIDISLSTNSKTLADGTPVQPYQIRNAVLTNYIE